MSLEGVELALLWFIALYPPVTAAFWIAGGLVYRLFEEATEIEEPPGGWPPLTLLIPAYNEGQVIVTCLAAAREVDYPQLQIWVLDDGSIVFTLRDDGVGMGSNHENDPRFDNVGLGLWSIDVHLREIGAFLEIENDSGVCASIVLPGKLVAGAPQSP